MKIHIDIPGEFGNRHQIKSIREILQRRSQPVARRAVLTLMGLGNLETHSGDVSDDEWEDFQSEIESTLDANRIWTHDIPDAVYDLIQREAMNNSGGDLLAQLICIAFGMKKRPARKHYIVNLRLRSGDIEKSTRTLVIARTAQAARRNALRGECHYDMKNGAQWLEEYVVEDVHGEWIYKVIGIKRVLVRDIKIVEKYFTF